MPKKTKKAWQYFRKTVNSNSLMPSLQQPTESQSPRLYHSINQLPLSKFIECDVDKNLSALIISGFPSQVELQIAWAEIQGEYADAMGDHEHSLYIRLQRDITFLEITIQQIEILVECLHQIYYEPFLVKLNGLLFTSFKLDPSNPEEYHKILKGCLNRSKGVKLDLDLKRIEFEAIQEKNKNNKTSREYYQSILITISDYAQYQVHDNITVYEFCERVKRYNHYCKEQEKKKKHG